MKKLPKGYNEYMEDLLEYKGLTKEELEYIETFYLEFYNDKVSFNGGEILNSPDMIKHARKNHNSIKRDAMLVSKKKGVLLPITNETVEKSQTAYHQEFWTKSYNIGGYKMAAKKIIIEIKDNIEQQKGSVEHNLILMLTHFRLLRNYFRNEKRKLKE